MVIDDLYPPMKLSSMSNLNDRHLTMPLKHIFVPVRPPRLDMRDQHTKVPTLPSITSSRSNNLSPSTTNIYRLMSQRMCNNSNRWHSTHLPDRKNTFHPLSNPLETLPCPDPLPVMSSGKRRNGVYHLYLVVETNHPRICCQHRLAVSCRLHLSSGPNLVFIRVNSPLSFRTPGPLDLRHPWHRH